MIAMYDDCASLHAGVEAILLLSSTCAVQHATDATDVRLHVSPVAILKKQEVTSWAGAQVMLKDGNFLKSLQEFDKDSINDKQIEQIQKYMEDAQFNPSSLANISTVGGVLLKWVLAMVNYYSVARGRT